MTEHVGKQLGYYQLLRLLGTGGFANVYLGEHVHLKSFAAIKVLNTRLTEDLQENFLNEARILSGLTHPGIIRLFDFGIDAGVPFLVMEYAPYGTLRQLHPRNVKLPLVMVTNYVNQIAEGLQYAHAHKLIHRDLKPDNVLIGQRGNLLLSDFGVALIVQTTISRNPETNFAGTAAYMAPEQLRGTPRLASDQYALGIMAYEWLCGTRPFHGTVVELYNQHAIIPPPRLREHVPDLPLEAEQVVLRALSKDPHERFPDVRAFAVALEQASQIVQGQGGADIYVMRQTASPHNDAVTPATQAQNNASAEPSTTNPPASFTPETPLLPSAPSTSSSAPPATPHLPDPAIPHTEPSTSQAFQDIAQAPVPPPEQFRPSQAHLPLPQTAQSQELSAPPPEDQPTRESLVSSPTIVQPTQKSPALAAEGRSGQEIAVTNSVRKKRPGRRLILSGTALLLLVALMFVSTNLSIFSHAKQRSAEVVTVTATSGPAGAIASARATSPVGRSGATTDRTPVSNSTSTSSTGSSANGHSSSPGALTPTAQAQPTAGATSITGSTPTIAAAPTPTATSAQPTPTPTSMAQSCTTYGWSISAATGSQTGSFTTSANCSTVKATINSGLLSVTNIAIQACTSSGCGSVQIALPGSTVTLLSNVAGGTSFYLKTTSVLSLGITISGTLSC